MSSMRGRDRPLSYPITSNINTLQIEPADLLGRIFTVFFQPPTHRFRKAADSVVQAVCPRNILPIGKLTVKDLIEILFEISHKYLAAFTGEQPLDALLLLLQMVQYVREPVFECTVL